MNNLVLLKKKIDVYIIDSQVLELGEVGEGRLRHVLEQVVRQGEVS